MKNLLLVINKLANYRQETSSLTHNIYIYISTLLLTAVWNVHGVSNKDISFKPTLNMLVLYLQTHVRIQTSCFFCTYNQFPLWAILARARIWQCLIYCTVTYIFLSFAYSLNITSTIAPCMTKVPILHHVTT